MIDDDLKEAIKTFLEDKNYMAERVILMDLAERSGTVILGQIKKEQSSGQGCATYIEALARGADYMVGTARMLLGREITQEMAAHLFEIGFETSMAKFGDPYDSMMDLRGIATLPDISGFEDLD